MGRVDRHRRAAVLPDLPPRHAGRALRSRRHATCAASYRNCAKSTRASCRSRGRPRRHRPDTLRRSSIMPRAASARSAASKRFARREQRRPRNPAAGAAGAGRSGANVVATSNSSEHAAPVLWRHDDAPIRIGVSSCLLGSAVRWDGGHKRDAFLADQLAPFVEWVPVCPELEIGMGGSARGDPAGAARGRRGVGGKAQRQRLHADDAALRRAPRSRTGVACALRLRAEEQVAELRHGARAGRERQRDEGEDRTGCVCGGVAGSRARAADRGRGPPPRSAPARELDRTRLRLSQAAFVLRDALERRRAGPLPHGPQAADCSPIARSATANWARWSPRRNGSRARSCARATSRASWTRCATSRLRVGT